ncbi:MAG: hypothetical protein IJ783_11080, partial [Kiritimatiellae bacterium]|nr:hypothetical protein [Kiritimatiellia bacterium]
MSDDTTNDDSDFLGGLSFAPSWAKDSSEEHSANLRKYASRYGDGDDSGERRRFGRDDLQRGGPRFGRGGDEGGERRRFGGRGDDRPRGGDFRRDDRPRGGDFRRDDRPH